MQDQDLRKELNELSSKLQNELSLFRDLDPAYFDEEMHREARSFGVFKRDLIELAKIADISAPKKFQDHRQMTGWLRTRVKSAIVIFARPFIRAFLGRQIRFNHLMLMMAYRLAHLEMRVQNLEKAADKNSR